MRDLKKSLKKYLLVKYTKSKLVQKDQQIAKSIPWIQRQQLSNAMQGHCSVLLNSLITENAELSLRENKFIVDSILKYTSGKGENFLQSTRKTKNIKPFLQLNSFVVYDQIIKGLSTNKSKKSIIFNIEKQLSEIQEKIDSKVSIEDILIDKINVEQIDNIPV